jgi:chemotaxis family two-component system response regulator Rcp1
MPHDLVGRPMEILLVEDSLLDARLTSGALRQGGVKHRLTIVRDGEEAIDFLYRRGPFARAPRPDLILLDLFMPKMDGRQVLTQIKADESLKAIPVVIMTSSTDQADLLIGEQLQVESYITKPVNFDKFMEVIDKLKKFWLADVFLPEN